MIISNPFEKIFYKVPDGDLDQGAGGHHFPGGLIIPEVVETSENEDILKNQLIDYIMTSPENTNPAILKQMIGSLTPEVYEPTTVTGEGDVSVIYNGEQIGVLNDSGTITLNTEGKNVEHDIDVEFTKPANGIIVEMVNSVNADIEVTSGIPVVIENHKMSVTSAANFDMIIPFKNDNAYVFLLRVPARADDYNVSINSEPLVFSTDGYYYDFSETEYPEKVEISITDKE